MKQPIRLSLPALLQNWLDPSFLGLMELANKTSYCLVNPTYGVVAAFDSASAIYQAAKKVRQAGYSQWDVCTPFPIHGLDEAMGLQRSRIPLFALIGGLLGFLSGMLMVWYMGAYDYPLIVGGKPYFSLVFPMPIAYEMTILFAAFGTFFGMFLTNRLPKPYHSVMNYPAWQKITDDAFLLVIESTDPQFDTKKTQQFLYNLKPREVSSLQD